MIFQQFFRRPDVVEVSAEEALAKQRAGAILVDVRELYEWNEGYIPGAPYPSGEPGEAHQ